MIKQYNIAITQKYNFPTKTKESLIPERLLQQSIHSLNNLNHQSLKCDQSILSEFANNNYPSKIQIKNKPIALKPVFSQTSIGAADTSTIKIGETKKGTLIAIRGAIILKQNKKYQYSRVGPFIFHITENNRNQIFCELEKSFTRVNKKTPINKFQLWQIPKQIALLLERWLQNSLTQIIKNGLILFDGSLTAGINNSPLFCLKTIINKAKKNNSTILAFSKITKLRSNGHLITDKLPNQDPPYILETSGLANKFPLVNLGDIYISKLGRSNYAFRLDIDKEVSFQSKLGALEKLIGNDYLIHGYPETLSLAHILCTFTANEIVAIKHFLNSKHGIKIITKPNMHRLLFGPFGKGESFY